jgi:hypothetical protein
MSAVGSDATAVVEGLYIYDGSNWQPVLVSEVTSAKIADGTIDAADLKDKAVTVTKINPGTNGQILTTTSSGAAAWGDDKNTTYTGSESVPLSGTTFQRAALTGHVTAPANSNATTIANGVVTSAMITDKTIAAADLSAMDATAGQVLIYDGSAWTPVTMSGYCSGAIVYNGAYKGPAAGVTITGLDGSFAANWTHSAFSMMGRDLCWTKTDIPGTKVWADAKTACAALTTDNCSWRLPNLKELQVLYEAMGGTGGSTTAFTGLDTKGTGAANGATVLQAYGYWSSIENLSDFAYGFHFGNGYRDSYTKTKGAWVRCVRSL